MAAPPGKRRLSPKARRALEVLANNPLGGTERLLLARGFSRRMLLGLVKQGLATLTYERGVARGKVIEVGKMRITNAGWDALVAEVTDDQLGTASLLPELACCVSQSP